MAFYLLISATGLLLLAVLYAFFHGKERQTGRPEDSPGKRPDRPEGKEAKPSGGITDRPSPAAILPDGYQDESSGTPPRLAEGMARLFSHDPPRPAFQRLQRSGDLRDDVRESVMSRIVSLKNFETIHRLQRIMGDPGSTMAELSRMITSDPILSAKILEIANSAYYGMRQKLNSISHAIMIIGMANLKAIVYHEGVLQALDERGFREDPAMKVLWQHVNYTSIFASYFQYLFGSLNMGNLFTLGLLHDIGKFIMIRLAPLAANDADLPGGYSPLWTPEEEEERYGISHPLVGRLALEHWGLSDLLVGTVALHHAPVHIPPHELGLDREALQYLLVLFLADRAAHLFADGEAAGDQMDRLHPAYHALIDRNRLFHLIQDKVLLGQLREAEAIAGVYA